MFPCLFLTVTSAAASPFEVLRVKSMILLEPVGWTEVLQKFIVSDLKALLLKLRLACGTV